MDLKVPSAHCLTEMCFYIVHDYGLDTRYNMCAYIKAVGK